MILYGETMCRQFLINITRSAIYHIRNWYYHTGADPGFDQGGGGPDRDRPKLPTVRSSVVRVK